MSYSPEIRQPAKQGTNMEILFFIGVIATWIILQVWVLPRFGIQT